MKRILAAACLLLALSGFSLSMTEPLQSGAKAVAVVDQQTWSDVAAPSQAPVYRSEHHPYQLSNHSWLYPYTRPTPGCTLKVYNAPIDTNGKAGAWSQPAVLTVKSGWQLYGGAWNQPIYEDAEGVAWKIEISDLNPADDFQYNPYKNGTSFYYYTGWGGSYLPNDVNPASGHHPVMQRLTEDAWRTYSLDKLPVGGVHTTAAPAPPVVASNIANIPFEVAYCRVTELGETALSASHQFVPPANPDGWTKAEVVNPDYAISEYHPQGTLGYHVYIKYEGGQWQRLPAPQCVGNPSSADDWLFPIWQRAFRITNTVSNAPTHQPAAQAKSRLSFLHRLLRGDNVKDADVLIEYLRGPDNVTKKDGAVDVKPTYDEKYIAVDPDTGAPISVKQVYVGDVLMKPGQKITAYCPIIDEWGNGDSGTTGGEGSQKFHRRIRASDFGNWTIQQAASQSGHTSWPTVLINNAYSRWYGCKVIASGGDALTFSDYSGGQCFGNQFIECRFEAASFPGRITCGIRIDAACQFAGHTASELLFKDCMVNGSVGAWIAGNQTANLRFDRFFVGSSASDSRGSAFFIDAPSPLRFAGGLYVDSYLTSQPQNQNRGVIFRIGLNQATLQIADIWVDAGFIRFIECNAVDGVQLNMIGGKLNVRGTKPLLGLFIGTQRNKSTWYMEGVQLQPDPGTSWPYVVNNSYRMFEPLTERTMLANMIVREPVESVFKERMKKYYGTSELQPREETGYKIPSGGGYIYTNSFTTGKQANKEEHP